MKRLIYLLLACGMTSLFHSCEQEEETESLLVVEATIASGEFPLVILTRSMPLNELYRPLDDLTQYIERWATVTLSDGEREWVLMGRSDKTVFPPYCYTTFEMRGEAGKTYTLRVSCLDGTTAEATAYVPEPAILDSLTLEPSDLSDTLRQVYAYIHDDAQHPSCYKLMARTAGSPYGMLSCMLGITNSETLPRDGKMAVNRGRLNLEKNYNKFFAVGDTVDVMLARITPEAYAFWRDYEDMSSLSRNPIFPATGNLHSNVKGGLGYFFGYGSTVSRIVVE